MTQKQSFQKFFLYTLIASLSISALIGIVVLLIGDFGETDAKILLTTLSIGGFSLTGLCCAALQFKEEFKTLSLTGIYASIISFLYTLLIIWEAIEINEMISLQILSILLIFSFSIAHACLLLRISSQKVVVNIALSITLIFIAVTAVTLIIMTINEFNRIDDFYYRLLGVFATLDALGTIVTPILHKVQSK